MSTSTRRPRVHPVGPTQVSDDVRSRLLAVPALSGQELLVEDLPGGLTNRNLKVTTPTRTVVVRLSSPTGSLLAIDREAEYVNSVTAARTGVAPAVVDYVPAVGVLVIEWIEGRTLTPADLRDPVVLQRIARSCRRLHDGARFTGDFDMFELQQRYLAVVLERGFRLPERYLEFSGQVERIRDALAVRDEGTVPCNNDLLAANLIDDGDEVRLIDYEYSGNNDACFELGNLWSEATLRPGHLDVLLEAYYGRHLRHKVARARLLGLMSKYGWMLWASIQDGVSTLDFDFWQWGLEKYSRAVGEFDSPLLEHLLLEVRRAD